jgi:hypothetical protein
VRLKTKCSKEIVDSKEDDAGGHENSPHDLGWSLEVIETPKLLWKVQGMHLECGMIDSQ